MRKAYLGLLAAMLLGPMAAPVNAETMQAKDGAAQTMMCNQRSEVVKKLETRYQESTIGMGVSSDGGVLEILSSNEGKTFTVLLTMPNGQSCLVSMGNGWENVKPKTIGPSV